MSRWYIGIDTGSKALAHYAKGASAKDHKWKTRSLRNGHWVYVYDDEDGSKSNDDSSPSLERVKQETLARKLKATQKKVQDDIRNKVNATNIQNKYAKLVGDSNNQKPKDSDTPKVSKEYLQELEYNSRKNVFPEGFKTRPATAADADLFKNKSSAETKKKVTISDHGGNTGIKTEVTKKKKRRL